MYIDERIHKMPNPFYVLLGADTEGYVRRVIASFQATYDCEPRAVYLHPSRIPESWPDDLPPLHVSYHDLPYIFLLELD